MENTINIVWFKRDLRVNDHEPLAQAARMGLVLPLYIVEPEYFKLPDVSRRHWSFIYDSLFSLNQELTKLGAPLVVRIGDAVEVLEAFRKRFGKIVLWSHEETGNNWTYSRDILVARWCESNGIKWHETQSGGVIRRLKNRNGWAPSRNAYIAQPIVSIPKGLKSVPEIGFEELPKKNSALFGHDLVGVVQTGGRKEGEKTLNSFLKWRASNYLNTISKPGISDRQCSRLSAHLAYGTLSVREVEQATKDKLKTLEDLDEENAKYWRRNLNAFISRLAWRCHFIQKLEQQPEIEFRPMHPAFEGMREPHHRDDFFEAWKTGKTGYPLVDACMRSLHQNGWITFRMRALVVSFASYHLWLDWRQTAPFLAQLFTDYEPGIHYSQFQMQSGVTGINAVRIYNPIKQSLDHDPKGKFIRTYLPELKDVSDQWIHQPWLMDSPPKNYPNPIVDHEIATRHARLEISSRWKTSDFRETAREVNKKLGSRSKQVRRSSKVIKRDKRQMEFGF